MENVEQEKSIRDEEQRILKTNLDLEGVLVDKIKSKITKKVSSKNENENKEQNLDGITSNMILQVMNLLIGYLNFGRNEKTIQLSSNNEQMI